MKLDEYGILEQYVRANHLKDSKRRRDILGVFLSTEKHLTADELYQLVKKKHAGIGHATVYRVMKVLCNCGLCTEVKFDDGTARYEHRTGHRHHDPRVGTICGRFFEVLVPEIERLQEQVAKRQGFEVQKHRLEIYGVCRECRKRRKKK